VRVRHESWRLTLNLSLTCLVGGALFALVGAWLAAWLTFGGGLACALAAALLYEHRRMPVRSNRLLARPSPERANASEPERTPNLAILAKLRTTISTGVNVPHRDTKT
jgi:hypothetical protein